MRFLLDVNVLVSLSFPEHATHEAAQKWFRQDTARLWATCPLTKAGFLRVVWGRLGRTASAVSVALDGLDQNCADPQHEFWPADIDLRKLDYRLRARLIGHNQIADMQLLLLPELHSPALSCT